MAKPRPSAARSAPPQERAGKAAGTSRDLLLNTAEDLFAQRGYEGTKVRDIAQAAGVNLGAIHYYWRTKEALCRAVLERRLVPVLEERFRGVEEVARRGGALAELVDASHRPSLLVAGASAADAAKFRSFYGRMLFDPAPEVRAILAHYLDPYARRFIGLVRDACPALPDDEFYWRVTFMYGAFLYAHTEHTRTNALWGDRFDRNDTTRSAAYLTRFIVGGLTAPPVKP